MIYIEMFQFTRITQQEIKCFLVVRKIIEFLPTIQLKLQIPFKKIKLICVQLWYIRMKGLLCTIIYATCFGYWKIC